MLICELYSGWCSYANLQTLAQCTTCVQANAGQIIVNGTTVDPDTFMSGELHGTARRC